MAITTRARVKSDMNIAASDTDDDTRIDDLITAVQAWIEQELGRKLDAADHTELYDGLDSPVLLLKQYPVASVTSVHVSESVPRVYGADELLTVNDDYVFDVSTGIVVRVDGANFPAGADTVQVVYRAGYESGGTPMPLDLERAAIEIIAAKLEKGKSKQYHITSETGGEGAISGIRFDDVPEHVKDVLRVHRKKVTA